MQYSVEKAGIVKVYGTPESACGSERSGKEFAWSVTADVSVLDNHGFVVEHIDISGDVAAFFRKNRVNASCEQVAVIIGSLAAQRLKYRSTTLTVTLTGRAEIKVIGVAYEFTEQVRPSWSIPNASVKPVKRAEEVEASRSSGRSC